MLFVLEGCLYEQFNMRMDQSLKCILQKKRSQTLEAVHTMTGMYERVLPLWKEETDRRLRQNIEKITNTEKDGQYLVPDRIIITFYEISRAIEAIVL